MEDPQKDAWNLLYTNRPRSWRGASSVSWMQMEKGTRVLDVGCGNGKTAASLVQAGCRVTGIDFSEAAAETCRNILGDRGEFLTADARDLPFADGTFDAVTAVHVLEHIPAGDLPKAIGEIMRVLAPGGRLCIQCFAVGDFRSKGRKEDVRNGILYRYFSEADLLELFPDGSITYLQRNEERTRFGEERRRIRCMATRA